MRSHSRSAWCVLSCIACLFFSCNTDDPGESAFSPLAAALNASSVLYEGSQAADNQTELLQAPGSDAAASGLGEGGVALRPPLRAFPGAEGFGAFALGGRGPGGIGMTPSIYKVTTLLDRVYNSTTDSWVTVPGSLREAVEAVGPRFVIFEVSGAILLNEPLSIRNPYITIAGQTAPPPGITIARHGLRLSAHDIVLQHVRVRMFFDEAGGDPPGNHSSDCILMVRRDTEVVDPTRDIVTNVIIDHCSLSWALDEVVDVNSWARDYTIQWSIISEASQYGHEQGPQEWGLMTSRQASSSAPIDMGRGTIHHCLFAHNSGRNPRIAAGSFLDFRNNIIYNWEGTPCRFLIGLNANFIGNYLLRGLDTPGGSLLHRMIRVEPPNHPAGTPRFFIQDNRSPERTTSTQNEWDIGVYYRIPNNGNLCSPGQPSCTIFLTPESHGGLYALSSPFDVSAPVTTDPVEQAVERVLQGAGASRPTRDVVDAQLLAEVSYVHETRPFDNTDPDYDPAADPHLRRLGPQHGEPATVLWFRPQNDPNYNCTPRQYRVPAGMSISAAKVAFLQSLSCTFPDGVTLPDGVLQVLSDPDAYQWTTFERIIPTRATVQALYPPGLVSADFRRDSDNDGIPDQYELLLGTDPYRHDSLEDANHDGYLNLENYLHLLAQ